MLVAASNMTISADDVRSVSDQPSKSTDDSGGLVKTIRYEEAASGAPPKPVTVSTSSRISMQKETAMRPQTAPATRRASHFPEAVKRDSGFGGSTNSQSSPALPPTPSLPAFVGTGGGRATSSQANGSCPPSQDEEEGEQRPRAAFGRRKSKKSIRQMPRSASPPSFKRLSSFRGLETDIPTGGLDDLDANKFGFTHRGSIFFGGKNTNDWFGAPSNRTIEPHKIVIPAIVEPEVHTAIESTTDFATATMVKRESEPAAAVEEAEEKNKEAIPESPARLRAGPRKPSVHMLQAANAGGRILSADEINFSVKVRSMYEAGDESGADWSTPSLATSNDTPDTFTTQHIDDHVAHHTTDLPIDRARQAAASTPSRRSQDIRASYHNKAEHELAGGIEDWQDIDGGDVDRYGFIISRREGDRTGSMTASAPTEGLHRVATGLRLAADQPRRRGLRRTHSNARSARSLPPQAATRPSSLHSATSAAPSTKSRRSAFRGKDRRITDAAGDMLTLPPGLADIAETQDETQTMHLMRRREWARNEKWQKMARPLNLNDAAGGGMLFDFDTNDPKVTSRTWKGIPDRWRATAWHSFLSASARRRGSYDSDNSLIQQFQQLQDANCADDYQIDVDVPRTISMHVMFRRRYRGGQRLLFRVLHAIALYFPETGYVQGMASLAATLLCYYDEERAFVMMVRLWQLRGLEQLFQPGFNGLMAALRELEDQWLAGGDMARKLNDLAITSTSYGTRWYLTLFNMSVPFPAQLRIWDVFMLLGDASPIGSGSFGGADLDVLHATSTALIDATREIIIDSDFENAMKILTSFIPIRDEDLLMRVARTEWKIAKKRNVNKATGL